MTWRSDHTALEADGTLTAVNGYFSGVLDAPVLDLELMKLCFSSISWAQFAVFEAFSDEAGGLILILPRLRPRYARAGCGTAGM